MQDTIDIIPISNVGWSVIVFNIVASISLLMIQRTAVYDRLCRFVGAEHHEQVAHHCCLLIFIKVDNLLVVEFVESHFYH